MRRTPVLEFRFDPAIVEGGRVDEILAGLDIPPAEPEARSSAEADRAERAVARRRPSTVHGVVVVDKAAGVTSHDVVDRLRRRLHERRIGHAGTLDPPATGVLVCGVGRATRLLPFVAGTTKAYAGEIVLGVATTTLDDTGEVVARVAMDDLGVDQVAGGGGDLDGRDRTGAADGVGRQGRRSQAPRAGP